MFIAFILLVGREKAAESLSYLPWLALAAFICFVAFAILRAIWDEIIVPIWEEIILPILRGILWAISGIFRLIGWCLAWFWVSAS